MSKLKPQKSLVIVEAVFLVVFFTTYGVAASFPDYIKVQGTMDIMKALVDVDGVLLGFVGIVYAQLFSSIMDQQNTIFARMLSNKKHYTQYSSYLKEYSSRKNVLVIATITTFTFLLISILSSLVNLARVSLYDPLKDTYAPFSLTFIPLFFIVEAVAVLFVALAGLPMGPPERPQGQTQTTLQKTI